MNASSARTPADSRVRRALTLIALIAAGETAFFLPFLVPRIFRPTVLEAFDLTNLELGTAYGVYGVVAMISYVVGGPLADRFGARRMLCIALLTTAAGGLILMNIPGLRTLVLLYAAWGITTIALFWSPLIRATREWGGDQAQGAAFGLLDGGRGLLAAATASVLVMIFASLLPADADLATLEQRRRALTQIILLLLALTVAAALLVWLVLPATEKTPHKAGQSLRLRDIWPVLNLPTVRLQALIILCAYVGFRSIDDFSLYAREVLGMNEVAAAELGTISLWVRPLAAVAAGILADRFGGSRLTIASFAVLLAGSLTLAFGGIGEPQYVLFLLAVIATSLGVFALRGLYFAIMQEGHVPLAYTGSAVGFVSLLGYTPDVFMAPLMGFLLDRSPGAVGHQHVFQVVAGFALTGLVAGILFARASRNTNPAESL